MEIKKTIRLNIEDYYQTHLSIVNNVLPPQVRMTQPEILVLSRFMSLKGELESYRFGPTAKKEVMGNLNISPQSISNHLKSLRDKGLLYYIGDILNIRDILFPDKLQQVYNICIINNNETINNTITNESAT